MRASASRALDRSSLTVLDSGLAGLLEESDPVRDLAARVAHHLTLNSFDRRQVETAALLREAGKAALMEVIADKPEGLTSDEFELARFHPICGEELLRRAGPQFAAIAPIVRSCHEHWDGTGFPDGLAGEEIPLAARIIACCEAYYRLTEGGPYVAATSPEDARSTLRAAAGVRFDPRVVAALIQVVESASADDSSVEGG